MTPPPRRRWFQFRLRTLLIFVAVVTVPLAWIAKERRQSWNEIQVGKQLDKQNGVAVFLGGRFDQWELRHNNKPQGWWRDVARKVLGERVMGVSCMSGVLEDLAPLASFTSLQMFYCGGMDQNHMMGEMHFKRDLKPLAKLKNLRWLCLSRCHLPDLSPVVELSNLTVLKLDGTDATMNQIDALRQALPNCTIEQSPPP